MKFLRYIAILLLSLYIVSCNAVRVDNDWPPNCCGPESILPPGNAAKFIDSVNYKENEVAPVQRPFYTDSYQMKDPFEREFNSNDQGDFDGVNSSKYFFSRIVNKNSRNKRLINYLTNNVESITFTDKNNGFIALSHPPTEEFAEIMNFNAKGIKGGTDIFQFSLDYDTDYIFKNLAPISEVNSIFWESHTFAAQNLIDGIEHTVLLWSTDKDSPFSKVIYKDGSEKTKGSTDIYYSFKTGDQWSEAKPLNGINDNTAYEGTPFIYCLCEDSYIFFSSNRNDETPELVDKNIVEDFDIFYANIIVDFERKEIRLKPGKNVKPFDVFKKTDDLTAELALKDYLSINVEGVDDRFPYVPNPLKKDENDTTFIYFSSNRNIEKTEVSNSKDFVLKNYGGYDIYRHPLDIPCKESQKVPPKLIVDIIDAKSGEKVLKPVVRLFSEGNLVREISNQNPAVFDSLDFNKKYEVFGGSQYSTGNENECGTFITDYYSPNKEKYSRIITDTIYFYNKIKIPAGDFANYLVGVATPVKDQKKYIDFNEYDVFRKTITAIDKNKPSYDFADNDELILVDVVNTIHDYAEKESYYTKIGEEAEPTNTFSQVNTYKVRSERTLNSGIYTFNLNGGEVINDKIYLATDSIEVQCKELIVKVREKCTTDKVVKLPCISIEEYNENSDQWVNANSKLDVISGGFDKDEVRVGLVFGKKYRVAGGSKYLEIDDCGGEYYYTSAETEPTEQCELTYSKLDTSLIKYAECNVQSELTKFGIIDTRTIDDDLIKDEIILKPVNYIKPDCEYEFTEIFTEYRRRVPYFQTAFWQVNTKENYRDFTRLIQRTNSLYMKSFEVPNGDRKGQGWPGAKWIELHPRNRYWNRAKDSTRWERRKREYSGFATTVDQNLDQMAKVIHDTLLTIYDRIIHEENCQDCDSKKFVIEVEAWSDYRPVEYGWYLPDGNEPETVKYAECDDIIGFNKEEASKYFTPVSVASNDPLGSDNKNLSILRAYFGYQELYKRLKNYDENNNLFNHYLANDLILLPEKLINQNGNLKSADEIDELVRKSRIIIIAKGYETTENPDYSPKFTDENEKVDLPQYKKMQKLSSYYNLDTIRTVQVRIRQLEYKKEMRYDDCCEPRIDRNVLNFEGSIFRKEKAYYEDE